MRSLRMPTGAAGAQPGPGDAPRPLLPRWAAVGPSLCPGARPVTGVGSRGAEQRARGGRGVSGRLGPLASGRPGAVRAEQPAVLGRAPALPKQNITYVLIGQLLLSFPVCAGKGCGLPVPSFLFRYLRTLSPSLARAGSASTAARVTAAPQSAPLGTAAQHY